MSRFLLLLVFLGWMSWSAQFTGPRASDPIAATPVAPHGTVNQAALFFAGYGVVILAMGLWSRRLARRVDGTAGDAGKIRRFNTVMSAARIGVPVWFLAGLFFLGWGGWVAVPLASVGLSISKFDTPGLLLGCLPAFIAWMGLWWSQYPADISLREQGLLAQLDDGMPIHRPPTLAAYLVVHLRLQLLFTIVPVVALVLLRDLISVAIRPLALPDAASGVIQVVVSLGTSAVVFLLAPEILRRVLHTEPLADGPLRRRLEAICRANGVGYKDVLLWRTENNMGNAAVMGVVPRLRYILMSDLLLTTMTDEQIEAVFAHEVGHIIHRHMLWFAVFFGMMMFAGVGLSVPIDSLVDRFFPDANWPDAALALAGGATFLTLFLFVSRKFERQADVFAARFIQKGMHAASTIAHRPMMLAPVDARTVPAMAMAGPLAGVMIRPPLTPIESDRVARPASFAPDAFAPAGGTPGRGAAIASAHVGLYGATVFSSALRQVARVNNVPINAWSWCHGSIARRISYLNDLSADADGTLRFDRFMNRLYAALVFALCASGAWAGLTLYLSGGRG